MITINQFIKHFNRNFRKGKHQKKSQKKGQNTGIDKNTNKTIVLACQNSTPTEASKVAGTKTTYTYKCHSGNVALFQVGNAHLYAGGWTRGADEKNCVVIDLTGTEYGWGGARDPKAENRSAEVTFKRTLESLNTVKSESLAWISMPIRDYGTPRWERETWVSLAFDVLEAMKNGQDVLIACTGGHGRTGLAISILLYLLAVVPSGENPVDYVHKHYCTEAVETSAQENYVYSILGLPYTAKVTVDYGKYNRDWWYDDDYSKYTGKEVRHFDYCAMCGSYKWTTNGVCDSCQDEIERATKSIDLDKEPVIIGTCPYCGETDVELTDHNGDMICSKCQDWAALRAKELAKIEHKHKSGICAFCGDNVENAFLYYNGDLICDRCYVDLYGSGLISKILTDEDKKSTRIELSDPETSTERTSK